MAPQVSRESQQYHLTAQRHLCLQYVRVCWTASLSARRGPPSRASAPHGSSEDTDAVATVAVLPYTSTTCA